MADPALHVRLLQGRPTMPDAPVVPSEAAQAFADWLEGDAPTPPLDVVRAESRAMARYLSALAQAVQQLATDLHAGYGRALDGSDLPTVAHAEYGAGFRAGACSVAGEASKRLGAALERAEREARAC